MDSGNHDLVEMSALARLKELSEAYQEALMTIRSQSVSLEAARVCVDECRGGVESSNLSFMLLSEEKKDAERACGTMMLVALSQVPLSIYGIYRLVLAIFS